MSLPPGDMQAAPDKTAIRPRFTKWDWVRVGVLALALSTTYLLIDIVLDPVLLPHAARAGRLAVLLPFVGIGLLLGSGIVIELRAKRSRVERTLNILLYLLLGPTFPVWFIVWLDPYQPNIRYASIMFTSFGLTAIGFTPFGLSLLYGLLKARGRHTSEGAYAERGVPGREEVVGLGALAWAATGVWLLAVGAASIYGIWLALTNPFDNATLLMSFTILCSALVLSIAGVGWIWWHAGRYARQTGDAALLTSTTVPSGKRAVPQRVQVPPDERPRWGIVILVGLGLFAFSLLTCAVLDLYYVQSTSPGGISNWIVATFAPVFSLMGIHRASARRYQLTRFWRLLVAAATFVVAGDALWIDSTYPHHSIVPPLGLFTIAVVCSTLGVSICRSVLLKPMSKPSAELTATTSRIPTTVHEDIVGDIQRAPRFATYLIFFLPLCIIVVHLIYYYGSATRVEDWGRPTYIIAMNSVTLVLASVVNADLPQRQPAPPIKKAQ